LAILIGHQAQRHKEASAMGAYFTPKTFQFLKDLEANNSRDWFKANQHRYEEHVREPALDFVADFGPTLQKISPHFVADTRKVGGSLFRIQRDTRFSPDKTPYKINTGMHFRHERAKDAHAPGFYVHLEPGNCFMGVGLWRPETKVAYAIRDHIAADPKAWKSATRSKRFADAYRLEGDSLTRPPKGFDADHPLIDDLRRKDFIATRRLTQKAVTSASFLDDFAADCKRAVPFMRFLCTAVDVAF
jgi:uncharacterized protein (TIGR02453 family)